jgi:hypothetical protein
MSGLTELVQKAHEKKALSDAMWCHKALPRLTGKWREHLEATMYYNLFKWAGWKEE